MISAVLAIVFAAILVVSIAAAGLYAWHLWRLWQERRKHTRERFLFTALGLLGRSFIAYMAFVFGGAWPITLLASWGSDRTVTFRIAPAAPSEIAILGATAFFVCLTVLTWRAFKHWNGETSEHERKYGRLPAREIVSVALLDRDRRRLMRHPARGEDAIPTSSPGWSIPGHLRALNLILAYDERYQLSENQWHSEERAFIGRYGTEEEPFIFFYGETLTEDLVDHINQTTTRYPKHRKRVLLEQGDSEAGFPGDKDIRLVTFDEIMFAGYRLREYERALLEELRNKRFGESAPTVQDMLVVLKAEADSDRAPISDLNSYILDWIVSGEYNHHIALLGEYGQGKSVLSIWLCTILLQRIASFKRVPILIQLGGKSPRNTSVEEMIDAWAGRYRINSNLARAWVETGHAVVIFDAFDEMDLVGERGLRLRNFMRIWEFADRPAPRLIITGRPNLFLDTEEMRLALKLASGGALGHHAKPIYLSKLDREQIRDALRAWPTETRRGILEAYDSIGGAGSFADLIARPSTLALAASVWPTIAQRVGTAAIGNTTIIREFLYQTYARQREKRDRSGVRPLLTTTELSFFMRAISVVMGAKGDATNRIPRSQIMSVVESVLAEWPTEIARIGDLPVEPTPERSGMDLGEWVKSLTDGLSAIAAEVAATGILVEDSANPSMLKMAHKSFYEYLHAEAYVCWEAPDRLHAHSERMTFASLARQRFSESELSREILVFAAELVYLFGLQGELHRKTRSWFETVWVSFPAASIVCGLVTMGGSLLICLLALLAYVADWVYYLAIGSGPPWLATVFSLLVPSIAGFALGFSVVVAGAVLERPRTLNDMRVSILCALIYERSLARILRQVSADRLAAMLGQGFTAIEIGQKYSRFNKEAFLPGDSVKKYAIAPASGSPGIDSLTELDFRMAHFIFTVGPSSLGWRRHVLLDRGFNILAPDVPSEMARAWIVIRSGDSFSKLVEVSLGTTLRDLPEYFRGRDNEVNDDAWYGLLASFSVNE